MNTTSNKDGVPISYLLSRSEVSIITLPPMLPYKLCCKLCTFGNESDIDIMEVRKWALD